MRRMWKVFSAALILDVTQKNSFGRETVWVFGLRQTIHASPTPQSARQSPQWRETIQMPLMQQGVYDVWKTDHSHENPHQRKTVLVFTVSVTRALCCRISVLCTAMWNDTTVLTAECWSRQLTIWSVMSVFTLVQSRSRVDTVRKVSDG